MTTQNNNNPGQDHKDRMLRTMEANGQFRLYIADTRDTVDEARTLHHMNPTPSVALGRLLTGAALMSSALKNPTDNLTLQIRSDGPIGGMVVVANASAEVRGYAYQVDFDLPLNAKGKFDISGAVGKGMLHVIRDTGAQDPYVGSVELISGEIAEDLTWYYASSEQTPTVMSIGVLVGEAGRILAAGGLFLQLMPEADEKTIAALEAVMSDMPAMTTLLSEGLSIEDIAANYFSQFQLNYLDERPVSYRCTCSTERMEKNLISLGRKELAELSEDEKGLELQCHFCSKKYHFPMATVKTLTERATRG